MPTIKELLERHGGLLNQAQKARGADIVARTKARRSFSLPEEMSLLEAQTGYIMVEREFSPTPVNLFGQDVASLAHTRISIHRARPDSATGMQGPGEIVYSGLISEKALTEAVLLSNRGEGQPMTTKTLGNFEVPARMRIEARTKRSANSYNDEKKKRIEDGLARIEAFLSTGPVRSSPELRDLAASMRYVVRDISSTGFILDRHLEEMSKLRTEVLTEAAHAALHADKVIAALSRQRIALAPPSPVDLVEASGHHPMLDAVLDIVDADHKELIAILVLAEIEAIGENFPALLGWICETPDGRSVRFPEARERSLCLYSGDQTQEGSAKKTVDELANTWNHTFNPWIDAVRALRDPGQASLSVSNRSGWTGDIHSSLPPSNGSYFSLMIRAAWEEQSLGSTDVRSASMPLVEIEIVAEDLMTALRGHPTGAPVPCSIRGLCGVYRDPAPRPVHEITARIDKSEKETLMTDEVLALTAAIEALNRLVCAKRSGKTWLAECAAAVGEVRRTYALAEGRIAQDVSQGRAQIDDHVAQSANEILKSIAGSLPEDVRKTLLLGQ